MSSNPALAEALTPPEPETGRPALYAVPDPEVGAAEPDIAGSAEIVVLEFVEPDEIVARTEEADDGEEAPAEGPSDGMLKTAGRAILAVMKGEGLDISIYKRRGGGGGAWFWWKLQEAKEHQKPCDCYFCGFAQ